MKLFLTFGIFLVYFINLSTTDEDLGFDPKEDRSHLPFNEENYKYALEKTKTTVLKRLREELEPKELKNATLKAKLNEKQLKTVTERYEHAYEFEKKHLTKHLLESMEKYKENIGRLTKTEIDQAVQSLVKDFGKGNMEPPNKEEL